MQGLCYWPAALKPVARYDMKERSESVDNHNLQWSWFLSTNVMPGTTIGTHTTQSYTHFIKFCKALSLEPVARYEGALRHRGRLLARIVTTCIGNGFYLTMGLIHQQELTAHSGYQNDTNFIKFCKVLSREKPLAWIITTCIGHGFHPTLRKHGSSEQQWELTPHNHYQCNHQDYTNFNKFSAK